MGETHTARVVLEGDAASLDGALRKAAKTSNEAGDAITRASTGVESFGKAIDKNKDAVGKFGSATKAALPNIVGLATHTGAAAKSMTGLATSIFAGAKAFGPWGLAVGVAGDALVSLVTSMTEAESKAEKLRAQLEGDREERERLFKQAEWQAKEDARIAQLKRQQALVQREYDKEQLRLRKEHLEAIEKEEAAESKHHAARKQRAREIDKEFDRQIGMSILGPNARGSAASFAEGQQFGAGLQEAGMMRRAGSDTRDAGAIQARTDATLRAIQVERAQAETRASFLGVEVANHDAEIGRIEREKQARLDLLQTRLDAATIGGEKDAIEEEMAQVRHEAWLARNDAEKAAEQQRIALIQSGLAVAQNATQQTVAGLLSIRDARMSARNAALAQGKSDKEAARAGKIAALEQTAAQLQALRNLAIQKAIEQTAMGIGALASFNYPSAALHFAAAATWGAVGIGSGLASRAVASRATGMRRDDSMAANGASGGGSGGSRSGGAGGPSPNDSPIPGSPGPNVPSAGGRSGGAVRTTVYQIGAVHTYGIPEREFLRRVDEGLATELSGSRRRRAV